MASSPATPRTGGRAVRRTGRLGAGRCPGLRRHPDRRVYLTNVNVPTEVDEPNSKLLGEIEDRLVADLRDKPVKICWGMNDPVFTEEAFLKRLWLDTFPGAEVVRIPHASHFVQEDAYEVVVPELLSLLNRE